ncbi:hypothetical protein Bbelb_135010 [Branchiostoma belcheri]|nr:hypothetical protein Bbelb_135010 [Branchiostoma belcheri]
MDTVHRSVSLGEFLIKLTLPGISRTLASGQEEREPHGLEIHPKSGKRVAEEDPLRYRLLVGPRYPGTLHGDDKESLGDAEQFILMYAGNSLYSGLGASNDTIRVSGLTNCSFMIHI